MTEKYRQAHELTHGMEIRSKAGVWNVIADIDPGEELTIVGLTDGTYTLVKASQEVMSRGGE